MPSETHNHDENAIIHATTVALNNIVPPRTLDTPKTTSISPSPTFILKNRNPQTINLHKRKKEDPTVTESITITITERITEKQFLYQTDTVYINLTVFNTIHDTITKMATAPLLTLRPEPSRVTVATTSTTLCIPPSAAAAQETMAPFEQPMHGIEGSKPNGPVIAGAVVGSLAGLALLMAGAWFGVRKWRAWKAKRNGHMKGVELQRRWEVEQEMRGGV
ncbi:MAG: hypothetical protein Q9198_002016 [Flavoplaca austrocitrina]